MTATLTSATEKITAGNSLTMEEMATAINLMMQGNAADDAIAQFLRSLSEKGETIEEIAGAAAAMRQHMAPIRSQRTGILDTCGTGGGGSKTFNVSTTAGLVAAAAGATVAKHGNRSITSRSGSADVLASLGVNIEASVEQVERCLDELGICFCFAPLMHPSMKHVGAVRRQLGIRTIFNIIGPLANPAGAEYQLLGAGLPHLRPLLSGAMQQLGGKRTLVVSGHDGLGDVTTTGPTHCTEVTAEGPREFDWIPADFGLSQNPIEDATVESPEQSAEVIRGILSGQPGVPRDLVVLNAAAGLWVSELVATPEEGAAKAQATIDSGAASQLLADLSQLSHAS